MDGKYSQYCCKILICNVTLCLRLKPVQVYYNVHILQTSSKQPRRLNYARSKKQQDTDKSTVHGAQQVIVQEETNAIVQEETDVIVQEETEGQGIVQEETDDNDYESDTLESESDIEQSEELNNYLMHETVLEIEREFE